MADDPMIVHDAETCYTAYAEAFNHEDMATVVRYIAAPYAMVINANAPMFAATPEAVRKQFDGALAGMKARGWVRSDFKIVHTWLLSKDHALLMSDIVRYKADKSVLEKGRYIYSIRRADPSWQITGVTNVDPDFMGPGDYPRAFG
jgi:ketosteroid isomerase-like protein